jgi:hypothetical protein
MVADTKHGALLWSYKTFTVDVAGVKWRVSRIISFQTKSYLDNETLCV